MKNSLKKLVCAVFVAGAGITASLNSALATPAITLTTPGTEFDGAVFTLGFEFHFAANETITDLGVYDSLQDGLTDQAQVGIWDTAGNLLRSVLVSSGTAGTLIGDFRYSGIAPFDAIAGVDYIVGSYLMDDASSLFNGQGGSGSVDAGVILVEDRFSSSGTLVFPDSTIGNVGAWLGANFLFQAPATSVSEPFSVALLGAGLIVLGALTRRRTKA